MPSAKMRYVIEITLTIFIAAYLLPPAITAIMVATTTTWNPAVATIFQVLFPILVVVCVALALMPAEIKGKVGI